MLSLLPLIAQTSESVLPWPARTLWQSLLYVAIFAILGILLIVIGFKVFDWLLPKVDVERELAEKGNIAVAIVMAAVILGVSIVIAVAMIG